MGRQVNGIFTRLGAGIIVLSYFFGWWKIKNTGQGFVDSLGFGFGDAGSFNMIWILQQAIRDISGPDKTIGLVITIWVSVVMLLSLLVFIFHRNGVLKGFLFFFVAVLIGVVTWTLLELNGYLSERGLDELGQAEWGWGLVLAYAGLLLLLVSMFFNKNKELKHVAVANRVADPVQKPLCQSCHGELQVGQPFCPHCGTRQQPPVNQVQQQAPIQHACVNCNSTMQADQLFCPYCGTRQDDQNSAAGAQPYMQGQPSAAATQQVATQPNVQQQGYEHEPMIGQQQPEQEPMVEAQPLAQEQAAAAVEPQEIQEETAAVEPQEQPEKVDENQPVDEPQVDNVATPVDETQPLSNEQPPQVEAQPQQAQPPAESQLVQNQPEAHVQHVESSPSAASTQQVQHEPVVQTCFNCHGVLKPGKPFCHHCGANQNQARNQVMQQQVNNPAQPVVPTCTNCNGPLKKGKPFCPHCGTKQS